MYVTWRVVNKDLPKEVEFTRLSCENFVKTQTGNLLWFKIAVRSQTNLTFLDEINQFQNQDIVFSTKAFVSTQYKVMHVKVSENFPEKFKLFLIQLYEKDLHLADTNYKWMRNIMKILSTMKRGKINATNLLKHEEHTSGQQLTDTEIEFLYYIFCNQEKLLKSFDPYSTDSIEVYLYSLYDICDTCTYSLLQAALSDLFTRKVTIFGYCWKKYPFARIWEREKNNYTYKIKFLTSS